MTKPTKFDEIRTFRRMLGRVKIRSSDTLLLMQIAETGLSTAEEALRLLKLFADPEPCRYDADGGCQEHGFPFLEERKECPQAILHQWLGDDIDSEDSSDSRAGPQGGNGH